MESKRLKSRLLLHVTPTHMTRVLELSKFLISVLVPDCHSPYEVHKKGRGEVLLGLPSPSCILMLDVQIGFRIIHSKKGCSHRMIPVQEERLENTTGEYFVDSESLA